MEILHVVGGTLAGGAAKGAYFLHRALIKSRIESNFMCQKGFTNNMLNNVDSIIRMNYIDYLFWYHRMQYDQTPLIYYDQNNKDFSPAITGLDITNEVIYKKADIIHFHWINNGQISVNSFSKIDKPIVWTFRDMWPFTGGCHYTDRCEKYKEICYKCPQLSSNDDFDLSTYIFLNKKKSYRKNIYPVAISNWLKECAESSYLFENKKINVIPNCIDTDSFFPIDKNKARIKLGLPRDKKVILFGAVSISDDRKGLSHLLQAIGKLKNKEEYHIIVFGYCNPNMLYNIDITVTILGYINDIKKMQHIYSAADVFIAPAEQEAFGKTIAESMSCGTPVVAFNCTGPIDIIDHKIDGYLAEPLNSFSLARGIEWITSDEFRYKKLCAKARDKVSSEFNYCVVSKKYIDLYKLIIKEYKPEKADLVASGNFALYNKESKKLRSWILNVARNKKVKALEGKILAIIGNIKTEEKDISNFKYNDDFYNLKCVNDFLSSWAFAIYNKDFYVALEIATIGYERYKNNVFIELENIVFRDIYNYNSDINYSKGIIFVYDKEKIEKCKYLIGNKICVIFGAGEIGRQAHSYLGSCNIVVRYYIDNNKKIWGERYNGVQVISPDSINKKYFIFIASMWHKDISVQIEKKGLKLFKNYLFLKHTVL